MDVWFCEGRNHRREANVASWAFCIKYCALLGARARENLFSLDNRLTWMSVSQLINNPDKSLA